MHTRVQSTLSTTVNMLYIHNLPQQYIYSLSVGYTQSFLEQYSCQVVCMSISNWTACQFSHRQVKKRHTSQIHVLNKHVSAMLLLTWDGQAIHVSKFQLLKLTTIKSTVKDLIFCSFSSCFLWALPACPPQIMISALGKWSVTALAEEESASCH